MFNQALTSGAVELDPHITAPVGGQHELARARDQSDSPQTEFDSRQADELLLDAFTRARRRFRGAVIAITERTLITNARASEILQPAYRRQLWQWAQSSGRGAVWDVFIELANGVTVEGRCYPVDFDGCLVGAVMHFSVLLSATGAANGSGAADSIGVAGIPLPISFGVDPALLSGWCDLTDSERSVAELVGRGLSNKQAGRQLFISRFAVDYHLRRIYRKLRISSRVELARLLGEDHETLAGPVPEEHIA